MIGLIVLAANFAGLQGFAGIIVPGSNIQITDFGAGAVPVAINSSRQVVGQGSNGQAFLWSNGNFTNLGTLSGSQT